MARKIEDEYEDLRQKVKDLGGRFRQVQDRATEYIEEHPLKATALAFGAGVIAGAVLLKLLEKK